ncbi:C39 family peptidase [Candidatus Pristimantibacillus sp. PTI5]|uniref:C39 family peptidase n=1 Tax=Candidatus Pristimantibacillus sp. PTI5 TaxID=3400422 RepID=UPI003B018F52
MKTKRFLGFLLALSMIFSFVTVASAEENKAEKIGTAPSGLKVLTPAENDKYFSSLSENEKAKINEKIRSAEKVAEEHATQARTLAATKISIPGTFTMYQQTQSYYCSPAVTKSIVQYLAGSSDSQATIASKLGTTTGGTDPTKVPAYLNSKQSTVNYIYSANPSQTSLLTSLYHDVVTMDSPGSVGISNSTGANWHYATNGHHLAVNAIYDDKSKVQFADPLGGTQSGWPYYYEKTAAVTSSVTIRVIW